MRRCALEHSKPSKERPGRSGLRVVLAAPIEGALVRSEIGGRTVLKELDLADGQRLIAALAPPIPLSSEQRVAISDRIQPYMTHPSNLSAVLEYLEEFLGAIRVLSIGEEEVKANTKEARTRDLLKLRAEAKKLSATLERMNRDVTTLMLVTLRDRDFSIHETRKLVQRLGELAHQALEDTAKTKARRGRRAKKLEREACRKLATLWEAETCLGTGMSNRHGRDHGGPFADFATTVLRVVLSKFNGRRALEAASPKARAEAQKRRGRRD